jgi:hypothetical protein
MHNQSKGGAMRYFIAIILLSFCVNANALIVGQQLTVANGEVSPTYHNEMDSVTDPHTPTIGSSTNVHGSPLISGDGVSFVDGTSYAINSQTEIDPTEGTIVVQMRPSYSGFPSEDTYVIFDNIGVYYMKIETSTYRMRYNGVSLLYYTDADLVSGQLITLRYTWAHDGTDVIQNLYINEASTPVATKTTTVAEGSIPERFHIGNGSDTGSQAALAVIEDVKIYQTAVAP